MRLGPALYLILPAALTLADCSAAPAPLSGSSPVAGAPGTTAGGNSPGNFLASAPLFPAAPVLFPAPPAPATSPPSAPPPPAETAAIPSPHPHKMHCKQRGDDVYGNPVCIAYSAE